MPEIQEVVREQNGGDSVSIDIDNEVAASIKEKLASVSPSRYGKNCCIYKVHAKFRKINEYAYTPQMVAIGPFHHDKGGLIAMEDPKLRYMNTLLSRKTVFATKLEECIAAVSALEQEARKCYAEPINLKSKEFVEMMVVDGLFIIELFGKSAGVLKTERDDAIFSNIWCMPSLVRDLILLENQLPMVVLKCLFELVKENLEGRTLNDLALHFFDSLMKRDEEVLKKKSCSNGKHLLDLLRKTFRPKGAKKKKESSNSKQDDSVTENEILVKKKSSSNGKLLLDVLRKPFGIQGEQNKVQSSEDIPLVTQPKKQESKHVPSVTELRQAGVKFEKGSTTGSFVEIKFEKGVLIIPPILVQDQTDTLLRNLIAAEQCCDGRSASMTSYAFLMDSLINSPADVALLRRRGIITNYLGDDEDVSNMFNKLCREVALVNFYYTDVCVKVNDYYGQIWHVRRAALMRDYFNSPWGVFSFVGAIFLILLTSIATIFAVLDFFLKKN